MRRRDRGSASGRIECEELAVERVDDDTTGLAHDEHGTRVVPDTMGIGAHVDESIERTRRNGAQIER